MNARVYTAVLGGVFLKAGQRHEPTKDNILGDSRGCSKGWNVASGWLFRSMRSACVHAAFSSTPCESALSSRGSESTKRQ